MLLLIKRLSTVIFIWFDSQALMSKEPTELKSGAADPLNDVNDDDPFATPTPQPTSAIFGSMRERCDAALEHIVDGLAFLEVLASRRDEKEAEEKKTQEQVKTYNQGWHCTYGSVSSSPLPQPVCENYGCIRLGPIA